MSEFKSFVCIICPQECALTLYPDSSVTGNRCDRGREFAQQEAALPSRVLTTTISVEGGACRRLPIRSSAPVPKHLAPRWLELAKRLQAQAPIELGEVLLRDALGTGTDIVAAKSVPLREHG